MNAEQLRATQAPIKARYKDDPSAGQVTLRARGTLGQEAITCKVQTGRALVEAGLHPATGGDGMAACSGDMLLEALVGCAGVTLRAVATAIGVSLRGGSVTAEGDLDLLVDPPGSPGYAALRRRADVIELDGVSVRVASLEDLVAMKRAAGRLQDQIDVESLELARGQRHLRRSR